MRERGQIDHTIVIGDDGGALFAIKWTGEMHTHLGSSPAGIGRSIGSRWQRLPSEHLPLWWTVFAWKRLFNTHHATIWRALRRRGLAADAAADATQETFLLAAERLGDIRPKASDIS